MRIALIILLAGILVGIIIGFVGFFTGGEGSLDLPRAKGPASEGGVYRSTNGGATFEQFALAGGDVDLSKIDLTALFEDPEKSGTWWVATAGAGLFVWEEPDQDDTPEIIEASEGDESEEDKEEQPTVSWLPVWGQEDVLKSATIYSIARLTDGGILLARELDSRGRIWKSEDGGATFRETYSAAIDKVLVTSLAVSPVNSNIVLAGLSDGLLIKSGDGGETWSSVTEFGNAISLIVFARNSESTVFGVLVGKGLIRSLDGGSTFEELARIRLPRDDPAADQQLSKYQNSRSIFGIAIHPTDVNQMMAATAGGLLRTRDLGTHWEKLPVPLRPESLPLRAVAYDPKNSSILYTTAGDGLYSSDDDGASWRVTRFTIRPALTHLAISRLDGDLVLLGTTKK